MTKPNGFDLNEPKWRFAFYALLSVLLVFVYPLEIDFPVGNQSIYYFWALKNAGFGFLEYDYLATQADPYPLFSAFISKIYTWFGKAAFPVIYWLINFIYVFAILEILRSIGKLPKKLSGIFIFSALFLFLHASFFWGYFLQRFIGIDLRWIWDSGLAETGLLRGYLQPSSFGVFLLLSLAFFLREKFYWAFLSAALAACFHANFLLFSGIFILAYLVILVRKNEYKVAGIGAVMSLALVSPYLMYVHQQFGPGAMDAATAKEIRQVIQSYYEGHLHFDWREWLNMKAVLQLVVFGLAVLLIPNKTWRQLLLIPFIIGLFLTLGTYLSGNMNLLNLMPWRITVVLFPVAFTGLLAYLVKEFQDRSTAWNGVLVFITALLLSIGFFKIFGQNETGYISTWRWVTILSALILCGAAFRLLKKFGTVNVFSVIIILGLLSIGLISIQLEQKETQPPQLIEVMSFVKKNAQKNQLYLIPPQLNGFRLESGVPVFVENSKFHSTALIEWKERTNLAENFYENPGENCSQLLNISLQYGITHILVQKPDKLHCGFSHEVFANEKFTIHKIGK